MLPITTESADSLPVVRTERQGSRKRAQAPSTRDHRLGARSPITHLTCTRCFLLHVAPYQSRGSRHDDHIPMSPANAGPLWVHLQHHDIMNWPRERESSSVLWSVPVYPLPGAVSAIGHAGDSPSKQSMPWTRSRNVSEPQLQRAACCTLQRLPTANGSLFVNWTDHKRPPHTRAHSALGQSSS